MIHVAKKNVLVLVVLAGCSLTPEYDRNAGAIPDRWKHGETLSISKPISADWWRFYGSAELNRLVNQALVYNLDLTAARERISQFRALAKIAGAPLWPAISAEAGFDRIDGTRARDSANLWQGGWTVSYEVDLWGRLRAGRDSARATVDTARFDLDALRLVVMSDVAQSYFAIVGLKERRRIARDNLASINDVLDIVVARFNAGGTSGLEVAQQQSERANAAAVLADLDRQIAQAENALAVLVSRPPVYLSIEEQNLQAVLIPESRPMPAGSLFDRRPDIRSAETQLLAAHADIGAARAAFYPRLQLGADNIFAAATLSQPAGIAVALASSLTAPIFQGGRLEGELERTLARRNELLEEYRKIILIAYREVEDALAFGRQSSLRLSELAESAGNAKRAYDLARDRYLAGAIDYQTLLIVQRSLFDAQDQEVRARVDVLSASVLLYKALGGGWQEGESDPKNRS